MPALRRRRLAPVTDRVSRCWLWNTIRPDGPLRASSASSALAIVTGAPLSTATFYQLDVGKETEKPAVRRPERLLHSICSGKDDGLERREVANSHARSGAD
jgi:hypothetical protein